MTAAELIREGEAIARPAFVFREEPTDSGIVTYWGGVRADNSSRCRLWKVALQGLAEYLQMPVFVCHFPPGTSKWNKTEHRMFSHITQDWRGRPLVSHEVIIQLIAATTTAQGLTIQAGLDAGTYPTGVKVTPQPLASVNLQRNSFHGEWNYCVLPKDQAK